MATITGLTAARMLAIEAATVTSGLVDVTGHLILTRHDGTQIDAGDLPSAIPAATTAAKGSVELATPTETAALTDATRAVTPFGLASALKTFIIATAPLETAIPTAAYPIGISLMTVTSASGALWTPNSGNGSVITDYTIVDRCVQTFYSNDGGTGVPRSWIRSYHSTGGGGGWTPWQQVMVMMNLVPTSFLQTTAFTSYPQGQSRLYFTTANASTWDFTGKAGEVVTYRDGVDFARQTWIKHQGGTGADTEFWVRTATAANGWSKWRIVANDQADTGWQPLTLAGGHTVRINCAYRVINGIVYLKGAFTPSAAAVGAYAAAVTIPAGPPNLRPAEDKTFSASSNTAVNMSIQVTALTGIVAVWISAATTSWVSLAGVTYPLG